MVATHERATIGRGTAAPIMLTEHAQRRCGRRNYSPEEVLYVLQYGRMLRRTGIRFYFLGERDLPSEDRGNGWALRLVGTTLLVDAHDRSLITIYKNPNALSDIRKKRKYRIHRAA